LLSGGGRWEILNIKIASLLRVFIPDHLLLLLNLSVLLRQRLLHVPFLGVIDLFTVEIFDGGLGCLKAIGLIISIFFLSKANE